MRDTDGVRVDVPFHVVCWSTFERGADWICRRNKSFVFWYLLRLWHLPMSSLSHRGCVYAMTKASLNQLAKNLACEWALDGIRVNCIAPGFVDTSLLATVPLFQTLHRSSP